VKKIIDFTPFPNDIYLDDKGRSNFPKHVISDDFRHIRVAKYATIINGNRCTEYYWSHWATLVNTTDGLRHYKLYDTNACTLFKIPLPQN
jgi:hypothetical protein